MEQKFSAHYDAVETGLKAATVGLVTNEEMKKRQEEAVMAHEMALARKSKDELREIREGRNKKWRGDARRCYKRNNRSNISEAQLKFQPETRLISSLTNLIRISEQSILVSRKFSS